MHYSQQLIFIKSIIVPKIEACSEDQEAPNFLTFCYQFGISFRIAYIYTIQSIMIETIKSKALRLLWEKGDGSKLPPMQVKKIKLILQIIDDLEEVPEDLANLVSFRPHHLKGNLQGFWSLDVTGNYRIIFRFENKTAFDLDYLDTH